MLVLGNDNANAIWEKKLPEQQDKVKPNELSDRNTREEFIKNKYLLKAFLENEKKDNYDLALYDAIKCGDIHAAARALAHGANVEWKNPDDGGRTPLHVCAILPRPEGDDAEWHGIECAELLLQYGANVDDMDDSSHNVLDCALAGNADREMVEYLTSRLE